MTERLLFLTGHLAEPRLRRTLAGLDAPDISWEIANIGVKVAALMTEPIVLRRLKPPLNADRVIFPGRAGMDPAHLSQAFGVPFERGPEELADLPRYLGRGGKPVDISRYDIHIFAEIVEASLLDEAGLFARAHSMRAQGADVIDLGCRPGVPFPELEQRVRSLKDAGFRVSVDSGDTSELRRGAEAGADFLLSLTEHTLDVASGTSAVPVLIPSQPGDLDSLLRAAGSCGIPCLLDPVLDPIHFGFTESLLRYAELRRRLPEAEILMGTGNLTELTDADSSGVTALLMGICSELMIHNVLVVQVSPHTRRTVAEHDIARRILYAARAESELPRGYSADLLQIHDRSPYTQTASDIRALQAELRDTNFRIATTAEGVHVYSGRMHETADSALDLYPTLGLQNDGAHAFYMGAELVKAEIAWRLGKRYTQDQPLDWGCATPRSERDATRLQEAGHTLRQRGAESPKDQ